MKPKHWPLAVIACLSACVLSEAAGPALPLDAAIRTPLPSAAPRINGACVLGARPSRPFHFQVPATGQRPMKFSAVGLPIGLSINATSGLITGTTPTTKARHRVELFATNKQGPTAAPFEIAVGATLALTPPMGWNNYNAFRFRIDNKVIRGQADTMVSSGLIEHGWSYINIDDGWEGVRDAQGVLQGNRKGEHALMPSLGGPVGVWLYQTILGIRPDPAAPGFKKINIKPEIVGGVTWSKVHHDSPYGRIESSWKTEGGRFELDIAIPANSHATVFVPTSNAQSVTEGGKPVADSPDIRFLRLEHNAAVFVANSGSYHFQSTFH